MRYMKKENTYQLFNNNFLLIIAGSSVSCAGDILYTTAISYHILQKTGSVAAMGMISALPMICSVIFMPFTGITADIFRRKAIIISMDIVRGFIMLAAAATAYYGRLSLPLIIILTIICSLCKSIFSPSATSALISVIPSNQLMRGQAVNNAATSLSGISAEAVTGHFISAAGLPLTIAINGMSFLLSALGEVFLKLPEKTKCPQNRNKLSVSAVTENTKIIFRSQGLKKIAVFAVLFNLLSSGCDKTMLAFVLEKGFTVSQHGYMLSAGSMAVMLCTFILSVKNFSSSVRWNMLKYGLFTSRVMFALLCCEVSFYSSISLYRVGAFANCMANAVINSVLFSLIPEEKRGGILGILTSASTGAMAVSTFSYGLLGNIFPLKNIFFYGSLICAAFVITATNNRFFKRIVVEN